MTRATAQPLTRPDLGLTVQWDPRFAVVVHNNDHNTFDEVIGVLAAHVPGCGVPLAAAFAMTIHREGACDVYRAGFEEAEGVAAGIRTIGVRVTVEAERA